VRGRKPCDGERLPRQKLEAAVLRQLASIYRDEQVVGDALAKASAEAEKCRPEFEQWLASVGAEITRGVRHLSPAHASCRGLSGTALVQAVAFASCCRRYLAPISHERPRILSASGRASFEPRLL
jgi:hypothetical protein